MSINIDTLYVGMTRPTLVAGVTLPAFLLNVMVTGVVFIGTKNIFYIPICIPIHAIAYLICKSEPRTFELLNLWTKTKGRNMNRQFWSSSSYSPLERFRPKDEQKLKEEAKRELKRKKIGKK